MSNTTLFILIKDRQNLIDNITLFQETNPIKDSEARHSKLLLDVLLHDTKIIEYLVSKNATLQQENNTLKEYFDRKISVMDFINVKD